jgi:hypothetical protein
MFIVLDCSSENSINNKSEHAHQVISVILQSVNGPDFKGYIPLYLTYEDAVKDFPYGKIAVIKGL